MNAFSGEIAIRGDFDGRNGAQAGNFAGGDHQLHHIGSCYIGGETRTDGRRVLQYGVAASRLGGEGPGIGQRIRRCGARSTAIQDNGLIHPNRNDIPGISMHDGA